MSDVVSHDGPLEAPSKKDLPEAFGGRRCAESELLLISEAVARLEDGMYGNFGRPEAVMAAKKAYPGFTIGFGPRKEDAVTLIDDALKKGELSVFVLPESNERGTPLKVPSEVLGKMIRIRGGLPDRVVQPIRIFAGDPIAPELLAALSKSALYLRRKEFEPWYKTGRKKRNWPSHAKQRNSLRQHPNNKPPMGRPSKQNDLRAPIVMLVAEGSWSARQKIADLVRLLLKFKGVVADRDTARRVVDQLYKETGKQAYWRRVRKRSKVKRTGRSHST
jgi:hypothetical protein